MPPLDDDENLGRATEVEGYKILPPCVIYGKIGQGGMGAVYRGRHLNLDIDVAVKCLKPGLVGSDDQFVVRFRREARSAAQINHQNVIRVFDVAEDQGLHYLIMELVQGETARERLVRKQKLAVGEALEIVHGAALGLAEAHRKGFIHRDIKPDNIMISTGGQVKVADLGLAKPSFHDDQVSLLSGTNLVMGTPQYMPPEQWENTATVTPAADVWALGATLYYLLVGGEAIQKDSLPRIMQRITLQPFPDPRRERVDVPDDVAEFVLKATSKAPADRFQDAEEFATAIEQLASRRDSLRDKNAAPTSQQNTLLSPPPAKTLARIKFWLDEHNQKVVGAEEFGAGAAKGPGATRRMAPPQDPAAPPGGTVLTPPPRAGSTWWWMAAVGVLALSLAALFLWNRNHGGLFVEADRLEAARQFASAIQETHRVHAEDASLAGKEQRLARLHAAWSRDLAAQGQFGEALEQIERSLGLASQPAVQQQKRDLLGRLATLLEGSLVRSSPGTQPLPRGSAIEFRGRLKHPLVAGLRLGESAVQLDEAGEFRTERQAGAAQELAVEVTLVGGQTVSLRPWAFAFEAAPAVKAVAMVDVEPKELVLDDEQEATLRIRAAKGAQVLIDGVAVQRSGDEEVYLHRVHSDLDQPPPIVVVVKHADFEDATSRVPLKRVARSLTFTKVPTATSGCRTASGNRLVTAEMSVPIQGQLNERATTLLVNGVPAKDVQWRDNGVFLCSVDLPAEGRNEVRLEAQKRFRGAGAEILTIYRVGAPALALAEPSKSEDVTAAPAYALVVAADEWTTRVTARTAKSSATLTPEAGTSTFRGQIALQVGTNEIVLEATNLVEARATLTLRVERTGAAARPVVQAVSFMMGELEVPVAANGSLYKRRGGTLKITASDPGAAVTINNQKVEAENPMLVSLTEYEQGKSTFDLRIVVRNAVGASEPFACRIFVDEQVPQLRVDGPKEAVLPGKPFLCFGTWADAGQLSRLVVGDQVAALSPNGGKATSGQWRVQLVAPTAATDFPIVAEDRAGNRTETTVHIEVRGTGGAPTAITLPAGFEGKAGADVNEKGYASAIVHNATGIELVAVGFTATNKPSFYAATSEVTELQCKGVGSGAACGDQTADQLAEWLQSGRGKGLSLPTPAEWDAMVAAAESCGIVNLRGGVSEWLQGEAKDAEWPIRSESGEPGTCRKDQGRPQLGFRVVLRLP